MRPEIFWIDASLPGRIAIMPRPRAGDWLADEVAGWRAEGVDVVVSLLEPHEVAGFGLQHDRNGPPHECPGYRGAACLGVRPYDDAQVADQQQFAGRVE